MACWENIILTCILSKIPGCWTAFSCVLSSHMTFSIQNILHQFQSVRLVPSYYCPKVSQIHFWKIANLVFPSPVAAVTMILLYSSKHFISPRVSMGRNVEPNEKGRTSVHTGGVWRGGEASKNLEEGCCQISLSPKAVGVIRYELMTWLNPLLPDARMDRQWLAA